MSVSPVAIAGEGPESRSPQEPQSVPEVHEPAAALRPPKGTGSREDFWVLISCNAIVFVTSVCIMVMELVASRLIADKVGNSLYTWTSVIGVVLAGITIGNYVGGRLADYVEDRWKALSWLFFLASLQSFAVLQLNQWASGMTRPEGTSWPVWVLLTVSFIFLLPAIALGTISPVTASIALSRSARTGVTVGNVYAWGALGSIVGTFLTGFVLLDTLGSRANIALTAGVLAVIGVLVSGSRRAFQAGMVFGWLQFVVLWGLAAAVQPPMLGNVAAACGWMAAISSRSEEREQTVERYREFGETLGENLRSLGLTLHLRDDAEGQYFDESNYSTIRVGEDLAGPENDLVKYLQLDKLQHSYFNPEKPLELYYTYEQVYAAVTYRAAEQWERTTAARLPEFFGDASLFENLPEWARFDRESRTLQVRGAVTPERRKRLLAQSHVFPYWSALEALRDRMRDPYAAGLEMIELPVLPRGVMIPESAEEVVRYDESLQTLISAGQISDELFEELIASSAHGPFYRAVEELARKSGEAASLFIGGGGFIFPRWMEAKFPSSSIIHVAELDPAVKAAVQKELGFPPDDQTVIKTFLGDARQVVDDLLRANRKRQARGEPPVLYDFVYGDAFNDFSVPWHLTTREFSEKIRELMSPSGVYLVNIIEIVPRTAYPDRLDAEKKEVPFAGRLPAAVQPEWSGLGEWQRSSEEFPALEAREIDAGRAVLAYRGAMSPRARERLLALEPQNSEFRAAVEALYRLSRRAKPGRFLGRYVKTICDVFPNVYVCTSEIGDEPSDLRDTLIVIASRRPLPLRDMAYSDHPEEWSGQPFAWQETDGDGNVQQFGQMDALLELSEGRLLTDDFAPVDNLLIPVFVDQGS